MAHKTMRKDIKYGRKNARRRLKPMRQYRATVKRKYRMYRKNNDFRRY